MRRRRWFQRYLVETLDHGPPPLVWIGRQKMRTVGVPSKSYYPEHPLTNDDWAARQEIEALFLQAPVLTATPLGTARPVLRRPEAQLLVVGSSAFLWRLWRL